MLFEVSVVWTKLLKSLKLRSAVTNYSAVVSSLANHCCFAVGNSLMSLRRSCRIPHIRPWKEDLLSLLLLRLKLWLSFLMLYDWPTVHATSWPHHHFGIDLIKAIAVIMTRNPHSSSIMCVSHNECTAWIPPSTPAYSPSHSSSISHVSGLSPLALITHLAMSRSNTTPMMMGWTFGCLSSAMRLPVIKTRYATQGRLSFYSHVAIRAVAFWSCWP